MCNCLSNVQRRIWQRLKSTLFGGKRQHWLLSLKKTRVGVSRDTAPAGTWLQQGHGSSRDTAPARTRLQQGHSSRFCLSLAQVTCCHPMPGAVNLYLLPVPVQDLHCHWVIGPPLGSEPASEVRSQGHLSQIWFPRSRTEAGV